MIKKAYVDQFDNCVEVLVIDSKKEELEQIITEMSPITNDTQTDVDDFIRNKNKKRITFYVCGDPQNIDYDNIKLRIFESGYQIVETEEELK